MFGLIRKNTIRKCLKEVRIQSFNEGVEIGTVIGIRIGRCRAGDPGIIVGARAEQEVEKILVSEGVDK